MTSAATPRHFLSLLDLSTHECSALIERAIAFKAMRRSSDAPTPLESRMVALIFDKPSTRTRTSFEVAIYELGGKRLFLTANDMQLGRGEPIRDTARVLSRLVDGIVIRTGAHSRIEELAQFATVPVINALTDLYHPCQLLADIMTWREHHGEIAGRTAAWLGDGNNVCHSWINAARQFDFKLRIATPEGYAPDAAIVAAAGDRIELCRSPLAAVEDVDVVVTDTWASMGQEEEKAERQRAFENFRVTGELMASADDKAIFMHCLPAYRGMEVDEDVLEGPQSVVWDEAENRMHAQKALLELLIR